MSIVSFKFSVTNDGTLFCQNGKRNLSLDHIVVSSRPRGSNYLEHGLHRIDRKVTPKVRLQHYLPALRRLQASDYALVLPRQLVEKFDVPIRELPFELASPGLLLYWHRNTDQDPANSWFRSLIIGLYGPDAN